MAISIQRISTVKWWQSLLLSFGIASAGLAIPIQIIILNNYRKPSFFPSGTAILLVILAYQIAPALFLFLTERTILRFFGPGKALNWFRGTAIVLVSIIITRSMMLFRFKQLDFLYSYPLIFILAAIFFISIVLLWKFFPRHVSDYFMVLGIIGALWSVFFAYRMSSLEARAVSFSNREVPVTGEAFPRKGPLFILIFDGMGGQALLENGQVDSARFPNFAKLASDGIMLLNATSNYAVTDQSIPTMLTGRYVDKDDACAGKLGSCPDDILSLMADKGYRINVYSAMLKLSGEDRRNFGVTQLIRKAPSRFVAQMGLVFLELPVPGLGETELWRKALWFTQFRYHLYTMPLFTQFMDDVDSIAGEKTAFLLHLELPHEPYIFDKDGNRHAAAVSETDYRSLTEFYEQQVQFVDSLLGTFTMELEKKGLYDTSTIIVTGDHGPRPFKNFGVSFPEEINATVPRIPLIIRSPGIKPLVSPMDYQHIDFKPTMSDLLGLPPEKSPAGVSIFATERPVREKIFFYPTGPKGAMTKFVFQKEKGVWSSVK